MSNPAQQDEESVVIQVDCNPHLQKQKTRKNKENLFPLSIGLIFFSSCCWVLCVLNMVVLDYSFSLLKQVLQSTFSNKLGFWFLQFLTEFYFAVSSE